MAAVALEHVDKVFANGVLAIHDFDLHVNDGECVVLVGPSGSGKSTTLRMIAGLETPSAGLIKIGGTTVNDLPARVRNVAMVFQRHSLYPHLNVRDNLALGLRLRSDHGWLRQGLERVFFAGRRRLREQEITTKVREIAAILGLDAVLERRPDQLSGGQQQRVALGRALVRQPAVFLLDEPLSNLDPHLKNELRRELHLLRRRFPATMLYVTHDQLEAMMLADRLVVLRDGVVQQTDQPRRVFERPCNRFVAEFIGWPAMNFVEGHLLNGPDEIQFEACDWSLPVAAENVPRLGSGQNRAVVLGLRPEFVQPATGTETNQSVSWKIALVEELGTERLVTMERGGRRMVGRFRADGTMNTGEMIKVEIHMRHAHWFDPESGVALERARTSG